LRICYGNRTNRRRALFQNALGELQSLFAAINPPEGAEEMTRSERAEHYKKRDALAGLRRELVLSLAARDAQAALDAFDALKIKSIGEYDPLITNELELQLATAMARRDPEKSYAVGKRQLDANNLNYEFTESLKDLHKKDSHVAAKVAGEVLAKIRRTKIRVPSKANKAENTLKPSEMDFWQISHFINTATELNRTAQRDKEKKTQAFFTAAEMRELIGLLADAYLTTPDVSPLSISLVMPEIIKFAPALAQAVRVKVGAADARQLDKAVESQKDALARSEKNADELIKDAERAAPAERDQRFSEAAYRALEESDAEKAQKIAARIKNRIDYEDLFEKIKEALPITKARRGDALEVRKMLAGMKTSREKIAALTELALALWAKGEKDAAKNLLDESSAMLPARIRNHSDLESAVKIADAYARVAPERAFTIIENNIAQSDEYISAGIKMSEYYVDGATEENELTFTAINSQYLLHFPNLNKLLKNLARADLERAISAADKFTRPEIRLFARLRILQALLDENAAEKENAERERLASDGEV
jgi:hypothetical protein